MRKLISVASDNSKFRRREGEEKEKEKIKGGGCGRVNFCFSVCIFVCVYFCCDDWIVWKHHFEGIISDFVVVVVGFFAEVRKETFVCPIIVHYTF